MANRRRSWFHGCSDRPGPPIERAGTALTTGVWGNHRFDPEAFQGRVEAGFEDILADTTSRRVVVVCHGGVLNSWLSGVIGRPHGVFFMPRYTSVSRVFAQDGLRMVGSLNELPHVETAGNITF